MTPQEALDAAIRQNEEQAHAPRTIHSYHQHLRAFGSWIHEQGRDSNVDALHDPPTFTSPPDEEDVIAYISARQLDGRSVATISLDLCAIAYACREAGYPDVTKQERVRRVRRGIARRGADRRQKQAPPLTPEIVEEMEGLVSDLDLALVRVMFEAALRVSEAAALTWRDISQADDGSGRVHVGKSKTDQEGRGEEVAISRKTYELLQSLPRRDRVFNVKREAYVSRDTEDDRVFGAKGGDALRLRIKRAGQRVGHPDLSGHSPRVGFAIHLAKQNVPVHVVARLGRWRDVNTVLSYTRKLDAAEALAFFD